MGTKNGAMQRRINDPIPPYNCGAPGPMWSIKRPATMLEQIPPPRLELIIVARPCPVERSSLGIR